MWDLNRGGTPGYAAPEALAAEVAMWRNQTVVPHDPKSADVWSLGLILMQLLHPFGKLPGPWSEALTVSRETDLAEKALAVQLYADGEVRALPTAAIVPWSPVGTPHLAACGL